MKRKILIPAILGVALVAGTGIVSARASPLVAVAKPAPTPDNSQGGGNLGIIVCGEASVSFTIKGSNIKGASAWYQWSTNDGAGNGCTTDISLSGHTGDTFSLFKSTDPSSPLASDVRSVSNISLSPGTNYQVDVSGGTGARSSP